MATRDEVLMAPYNYLAAVPGKDVRGTMMNVFQDWLQIDSEKLVLIKEIIGSLHNASLLIDDIEDNSKLRRGVPVAHAIYGIPLTINCANYVYFMALEKVQKLNNPEAMNVFVTELLNLHKGQGLDIYWREQCLCPTESEYKSMVLDKTGGLFRLAAGLMRAFSTVEIDFDKFDNLIRLFGLYFQIRDDYMNIADAEYMQTKTYCEDLTEGKFSFPIIHAVNSDREDKRLLNILRQRTEDDEVKRHAVEYIRSCGSVDYTLEVLCDIKSELDLCILNLGGHNILSALLDKLHCKLTNGNNEVIADDDATDAASAGENSEDGN